MGRNPQVAIDRPAVAELMAGVAAAVAHRAAAVHEDVYDEHHARLRDTLLVFLESGGS
jgi:hypothetical protein